MTTTTPPTKSEMNQFLPDTTAPQESGTPQESAGSKMEQKHTKMVLHDLLCSLALERHGEIKLLATVQDWPDSYRQHKKPNGASVTAFWFDKSNGSSAVVTAEHNEDARTILIRY